MENVIFYVKKIYSKLPVLTFDVLAIPLAWYLAYWLRYNMQPYPLGLRSVYALEALSILLFVQIACYYHFRVYRGLWRFSSVSDVMRILRAVGCAMVLVTPIFYLTSLLHAIPRSVIPLYGVSLVTLLCGARLMLRNYWDKHNRDDQTGATQRVLIVGAGQAGESLIRDLRRTASYFPVGLLDDDPTMRGHEVHGIRVLGPIREVRDLAFEHQVDLIFIAIPTVRSAAMRRIVTHCEACNLPIRTLPSIQALASGRVEVNALREVRIEDLLGRDQVELNWDKINVHTQGKRVAITGGGGSIGSELCRQIMSLNPQKMLIIDNNEFNLYKIDLELKERFPGVLIELALVSITDQDAVTRVFRIFSPEIVFHAAAYKHVPLLENQVSVAVYNNVIGTQIVAEASLAVSAEKFILISTDKAVNPTSVMGASKRVAEIYCQNLNARVAMQLITVRFGNVLGSLGSVVPLFQEQLKRGGPMTVTHPDIERYFMTIPEACQLILQAMANGVGGEIFVLDMGEPVKISYLAEQMIRLAGKEPEKDIKIEYTGLRPGEKLFEELFHVSERLEKTEHEKLFKANFRQVHSDELTKLIELLEMARLDGQDDVPLALLKDLLSEFSNSFHLNDEARKKLLLGSV